MADREIVLIEVPGHGEFYVEADVLTEGGEGPIPCFEHAESFDSYAHVMEDGTVKRYGTVICHRSDLRRAEPVPSLSRERTPT